VHAVAFSPDGTLVATGSEDNTARVFEARTGREVSRLAHQAGVHGVAFSPDGTLVATHSADNPARVFEARTGHEVARLAHPGAVYDVAFSPDSTLLATGSADGTARVFEARTGREVARLALGEPVFRVDFVLKGRFLRAVSGSDLISQRDSRATQDPIRISDLIADACSKLDRNLTREEWTTYLGDLPYRESCQQLNPAALGKQK
jgi:WD40 repeat protein